MNKKTDNKKTDDERRTELDHCMIEGFETESILPIKNFYKANKRAMGWKSPMDMFRWANVKQLFYEKTNGNGE
jgi:hypothetical protein